MKSTVHWCQSTCLSHDAEDRSQHLRIPPEILVLFAVGVLGGVDEGCQKRTRTFYTHSLLEDVLVGVGMSLAARCPSTGK